LGGSRRAGKGGDQDGGNKKFLEQSRRIKAETTLPTECKSEGNSGEIIRIKDVAPSFCTIRRKVRDKRGGRNDLKKSADDSSVEMGRRN